MKRDGGILALESHLSGGTARGPEWVTLWRTDRRDRIIGPHRSGEPVPGGALVVFAFALAACSSSGAMTIQGDAATLPPPGDAFASSDQTSGDALAPPEQTSGDAALTDVKATDGSEASDATLESESPTGSDGGPEADAGGVQCRGPGPLSFPTFDKHCASSSDCVLVVHTLSCCGNVLVMAINQDALSSFQAAESLCNSQYPACGCSSNSVTIEDGVAYGGVNDPTSAASAVCTNDACRATFTGPTFSCGDKNCATGVDYCERQNPADGAAVEYQCVFTGISSGDAGISCANLSISMGCTCTETQGNVTVTCPS